MTTRIQMQVTRLQLDADAWGPDREFENMVMYWRASGREPPPGLGNWFFGAVARGLLCTMAASLPYARREETSWRASFDPARGVSTITAELP